MAAPAHAGIRPTYIELDHRQITTLSHGYGEDAKGEELLQRLKEQFTNPNTVLVLDPSQLRIWLGNVSYAPRIVSALLKHCGHRAPIMLTNVSDDRQCPIKDMVFLAADLLEMPICYWTKDRTAKMYNWNCMTTAYQNILSYVYANFEDGREFTTSDLVNIIPMPDGKTLSTHSSSVGSALKNICVKYPQMLSFDSRMVRNDNPKIRNQNTFFYSIHKPQEVAAREPAGVTV